MRVPEWARRVQPSHRPRDRRLSAGHGIGAARALSAILLVTMAAASAAGFFARDLHQDPESVAAMFRGYDLVALVLIIPILALTLLPAMRRSARAELMWLAALAYSVYHSAIYLFGSEFNDIFLLHVAVFSLSVFAFGLAIANLDVARIARTFSDRTPVRLVAGICLLLAATLSAFWSAPSLRFAITGEPPTEGSELIVPLAITHLGWALDLSLLVPAYAAAGILLWRRVGWDTCSQQSCSSRACCSRSSTWWRSSSRPTPTSLAPGDTTRSNP